MKQQSTKDYSNLIVESVGFGIITVDSDGKITTINPAAEQLTGYRKPEALGKPITSAFTPDSAKKFTPRFEKFKKTGSESNLDFEVVRKDGSKFHVLINSIAIYDVNDKYISSRSTMMNVTELKKTEDALRKSEEKYFVLFNKLAVPAILEKYPDGHYVSVNEAFTKNYGCNREEMLGKISLDIGLLKSEDRSGMFKTFVEQGKFAVNELSVFTKSGEERIELTGQSYIISTASDITEQKKVENSLKEAMINLETANKELESFSYSVLHDLRAPLR